MKTERQFVTPLHQATKRNYISRMVDNKVDCMIVAKKYDIDYWDGERKFGYGGYRYIPDRWKPVAQKLIDTYNLNSDSSVLDVGCGKGYLLYEIKKILPGINILGFDISTYGLKNSKKEIKDFLFFHDARENLNFKDNEFDLVISLATLHNLKLFDLRKSIKEIERVGVEKYIMVESYRNEKELFNLQCWALTAEMFLDKDNWIHLFNDLNYNGDFEFIYFE